MNRRQRLGRWSMVAALCATVGFTAQGSSQADEWYPGLPDNVQLNYFDPGWGSGGNWGAAASGGISYAKRAKQWFRAPAGMVTFVPGTKIDHPNPPDAEYHVKGVAFIVSPKGAPANYGYMPPMTVRSVGFGLMPVEATVQVSQRRKNGYPIPLEAQLDMTAYGDPTGTLHDDIKQVGHPVVIEDAFNIRILEVKVDGVDVGLTGDCRTATPAPVKMSSPEFTIPLPHQPPHDPKVDVDYFHEWFRTHDPSEYFSPTYGGELNGTITIPPFTGCTTKTGDDLSALMTLSVSGSGNPVTATAGFQCASPHQAGAPLAPGQSTPKLTPGWGRVSASDPGADLAGDCYGPAQIPYPPRPSQ